MLAALDEHINDLTALKLAAAHERIDRGEPARPGRVRPDQRADAALDSGDLVHLYWDADQDISPDRLYGVLDRPRTRIDSGTTVGPMESLDPIWVRATATDVAVCRISAERARPLGQAAYRGGAALIARRLATTRALGPYQVQAAIAAVHSEAASVADTDWAEILALYELLAQVSPGPLVSLGKAVAVAMVHGPAAAWPRPTNSPACSPGTTGSTRSADTCSTCPATTPRH